MKAILYIKDADKNGKLDLKTCSIYSGDMSKNKHLSHLTKKGYYSKKPLYVDFATIERVKTAPSGNKYIELTDEEYDYLLDNYTAKGKIFQTAEQRYRTNKAVGDLAWCASMKDPYDRG
jgi:hypothetical protein